MKKLMKNKKRKANHITTKSDYLSLFPDDKESSLERKRALALKEAQDIRKFEINLYWKRTGFFWAFITVIYATLFNVLCKYIECSATYSVFIPVISALAGLGFFFSLAWHMVNKGSKFWQKNWETHVCLLERSEIGPLYDVYLNPRGSICEKLCPIKPFDFSVTKVNMWASALMSIISLIAGVGLVIWLCQKSNCIWFSILPAGIIALLAILVFFVNSFSQGNNDLEFIGEEENELNMICIL